MGDLRLIPIDHWYEVKWIGLLLCRLLVSGLFLPEDSCDFTAGLRVTSDPILILNVLELLANQAAVRL